MFRRLIARGNLHRSDYLRALITDTSPGDVPIIFSNDGFYKNLKRADRAAESQWEFVERVLEPERRYTFPYRYSILREGRRTRQLSLTHPSAQVAVTDFYSKFDDIICYYCQTSANSLRSPYKVGSTFFVRGPFSEANRMKASKIDTVDVDTTISNPSSYFAYRGHNRVFRFFESREYLRLEKTYGVMYFSDISKCFSSIYTHTLFWATTDTLTAKDNTQAEAFSNEFDRLMQSMNFNETNGICIGAEISRIFAEVLLSHVDRSVINFLSQKGFVHRKDFEFKRYVDDYFIFAVDDAIAQSVLSAIGICLNKFNLHLSDTKTSKLARPFVTVKSKLVRDANSSLEEFFVKFLNVGQLGAETFLYPRRVRRSTALLRSLVDSIKGTCLNHSAGYEMTSNYIIGALVSRIDAVINGYARGIVQEQVHDEDYVQGLMLLLEAAYFFYNVDPTVPSSLRISQAAVKCSQFFAESIPHRHAFLAEQIVRWTFEFIRGLRGNDSHNQMECVPLEALNVLLVLGEVGHEEVLAQQTISEFCGSISALDYLEIISFLFAMRDVAGFENLRDSLFERARAIALSGLGVRIDAQSAHMAFDILSCPYISIAKRTVLFNELRSQVSLAALGQADAEEAVRAFEDNPWFVDWRDMNLLRMIRKKELSGVY